MKKKAVFILVITILFALLSTPSVVSAQFPGLGDISDAINKVKKTKESTERISKGASGLSLEEEVAIGDAVALMIVMRYGGVWRDEAATYRVNLIGDILARYATRQDLQWRFGLLDSDAINAFSAPGGRVFITRGLYELPLNDDELAGVLAHEIIHIDERHAIDIIARGELLGGVSDLVADNNASYAQFESVVGNAAELILVDGFDAGTEYEADEGGRNLALITGYAPGGLRTVLVKIDDSDTSNDEVFSTHPATEDRLKRLPDDPPPLDSQDSVSQN